MNTHIDVALILCNPDVIELVSLVLLRCNLKSCGVEPGEGTERIEDLIAFWNPHVVVFDLDPPYERSAAVALHLLDRFPDCSFIMTCADAGLALKRAPWLRGQRLFQKPYALSEIADAVQTCSVSSQRSASSVTTERFLDPSRNVVKFLRDTEPENCSQALVCDTPPWRKSNDCLAG